MQCRSGSWRLKNILQCSGGQPFGIAAIHTGLFFQDWSQLQNGLLRHCQYQRNGRNKSGGFEGQLHVPFIIGRTLIAIEVMLLQKRQKAQTFSHLVFMVMLQQHRQFYQLVQFRVGNQQQRKAKHGNDAAQEKDLFPKDIVYTIWLYQGRSANGQLINFDIFKTAKSSKR